MNRLAKFLLCAAALAVVDVRIADAQPILSKCDKAMADAEAMGQQVVLCASTLAQAKSDPAAKPIQPPKGRDAAPIAVVRTSVTVWVEVSSGTIPEEIDSAARAEPLASRLMAYYTWSAFTEKNPSLCSPLKYLAVEAECRREAEELELKRSWVASAPEFKAACGQIQPLQGKKFSAECCALAGSNRGSNPCAKLVPQCVPNSKACGAFFAGLSGDAGFCEQLQAGMNTGCSGVDDCQRQREECRSDAAFAQALRAKSLASCGASDRCRVLMGDGRRVLQEQALALQKTPAGRWFMGREWQNPSRKAADVLRPPVQTQRVPVPAAGALAAKGPLSLKGFICEEPLGSPANRKAANDAVGAARGCLAAAQLSLPRMDRATALDLDAREEKLARWTLRLNAIFDGK